MAETTVTKQLTLSFLNGEGKNTSISLSEMNESVTPEVAQAAMEAIVTENIFEKDGVIVYQTPKKMQDMLSATLHLFMKLLQLLQLLNKILKLGRGFFKFK